MTWGRNDIREPAPPMTSISREETAHLARLARIDLGPDELDHLATQLDAIVEYVARVSEVAADDKLATTIVGIDVSEQLALTDVFVIVSASSDRQVNSLVDEVEDQLRLKGAKPLRREGERDGRWVLLDFGDIVVHVQHDEEREFYELERLWKDCPEIDLGVPKRRDG